MVCFAPIYSRPISIGMKATIQHGHPRMPSITQVEADYEEDGIMVDIHRYTGIVNVDENNKHEFHNITKELRSLFHTDRLTFYPGFIRIEDNSMQKMKAPSIIGASKRDFYFDLHCEGEDVNFYPIHRNKMCSAVKLNTYIIGPSGEFYKCWNDVGYKDRIIGYINKENLDNQSLLLKYLMDGTMFDSPECRDCFFFPICGGGCPQYRLKNKYNNGKFNLCSTFHDGTKNLDYLNRCLEEYYLSTTKNTLKFDEI